MQGAGVTLNPQRLGFNSCLYFKNLFSPKKYIGHYFSTGNTCRDFSVKKEKESN